MKKENRNVVYCPPCGESTLKGGKGGKKGITFVSPSIGTLCHFLRKGGRSGGFTLIELLVVVLIIGILAAVAVPQYQKAVEKSRATQALTLLKSLVQAQKTYYLTNGQYATKFNQLDVDMPGWTGNKKWGTAAIEDTRSNGEWSLQIFAQSGNNAGNALYMGRISGKYAGGGFMYWFDRPDGEHPTDVIICQERASDGVIFNGTPGDYCQKIVNGTKYKNRNNSPYLLPY